MKTLEAQCLKTSAKLERVDVVMDKLDDYTIDRVRKKCFETNPGLSRVLEIFECIGPSLPSIIQFFPLVSV